MKILMMTNTYAPHVGGVARSVEAFAREYRRRGHEVLIVCPNFEGAAPEEGVIRVPAIQNFNGSDFSVVLSTPRWLRTRVTDFAPDIVHSHHPFLLGATAVRLARLLSTPLIFTHHTMYERYTHYVPGDSPLMKRFATHLSTNYANLSDTVLAPSESVAAILRKRGVEVPIHIVPTGVDLEQFETGSGRAFREILGIPEDAFVIGHVGRLAPEKNLHFLTTALAEALSRRPEAHALIIGDGPAARTMREEVAAAGVAGRVHFAGTLKKSFLVSAYKAMNVFAFASHSETQGMVLTEAMAASVPVVAVDAPGVREVVTDGVNGRLLPENDAAAFVDALNWVADRPAAEAAALRTEARRTAEDNSMPRCADKALAAYRENLARSHAERPREEEAWARTQRLLQGEWELIAGMADAARSVGERDDDVLT